MFQWIGPKRISGVLSDLVYDVTSLVDGKTEQVHASRIQLYRADLNGNTISEKLDQGNTGNIDFVQNYKSDTLRAKTRSQKSFIVVH